MSAIEVPATTASLKEQSTASLEQLLEDLDKIEVPQGPVEDEITEGARNPEKAVLVAEALARRDLPLPVPMSRDLEGSRQNRNGTETPSREDLLDVILYKLDELLAGGEANKQEWLPLDTSS